jgi:hypothetical protein
MRLLNLMTLIEKNQNKKKILCHFVHHKSQTDWLQYEPKSFWWVAGNGTARYETWIPHKHNTKVARNKDIGLATQKAGCRGGQAVVGNCGGLRSGGTRRDAAAKNGPG